MEQIDIKKHLLTHCKDKLALRRAGVQKNLDSVIISLREETKSSAGDKHETGRAMLQLERENAGKQLAEIEKLEAILERISFAVTPGPVHLGSVVKTSKANYFMSIPVGEVYIENEAYYAIGIGSPIGQVLLGKSEGDEIRFRESIFKIRTVY